MPLKREFHRVKDVYVKKVILKVTVMFLNSLIGSRECETKRNVTLLEQDKMILLKFGNNTFNAIAIMNLE